MSDDNLEQVLANMNRQYDKNHRDTEMEFRNNDDDEDVVDMNYLLAPGQGDEFDSSPHMKQNQFSAKGPQHPESYFIKRSQSSTIVSPSKPKNELTKTE